MEKVFIKNRKGQKLAVLVDQPDKSRGLVFVMHGLGGFKEQPQIATIAAAFFENHLTVVRFDTTNTLGESDGQYEDATVTNYYEDLEDVVKWSASQSWYKEPFYMAGHSIGGMCITLFTQAYSSKVKALAPVSVTISGKLSLQKHESDIDQWRREGILITQSRSKPGTIKKLKWSHMEDRLKYDLLPLAKKLTMPVLQIFGDKDGTDPLSLQKQLFDLLPGKKELHLMKGAGHDFREAGHLQELKQILDNWIKSTL